MRTVRFISLVLRRFRAARTRRVFRLRESLASLLVIFVMAE